MKGRFTGKENWASAIVGCLVLAGVGYVVTRSRQPAPAVEITPSLAKPAPAPPLQVTTEVVVHVAGAVKVPGVLHLPPDARVEDALKRAGGATDDAVLDEVNLAAKVADGSQIYIPHKEATRNHQEVAEPYRGGISARKNQTSGGSKGTKHPSSPVNLNTSTLSQLQQIPGVGPATASLIADYRRQHGGFASIEELRMIRGIGPKKLEKMRPWVRL